MFEELVLGHGERLQVVLHPGVEPGRVGGRVQRHAREVLRDHVAVVAVLLGDTVQHQLRAEKYFLKIENILFRIT